MHAICPGSGPGALLTLRVWAPTGEVLLSLLAACLRHWACAALRLPPLSAADALLTLSRGAVWRLFLLHGTARVILRCWSG